jgi:hypothetical protein
VTDRRRAAGWVGGWIALVLAPAGGWAGPLVVVEAPPALAAQAREVRAFDPATLQPALRLVGLDEPGEAGPPVTVLLAPEDSAAARSAPPWVTGFADSGRSVAVLLPERVPHYPDRNLGALYRHEVTHILIDRAARGQPVPRWFHEGVAMAAGREGGLEGRARVALAVLVKGQVSLDRIDRAFAGGEREVQSAYALAEDLVQDLLNRHPGEGEPVTAAILRGVGEGRGFASAFRDATGESIEEAEAAYWKRRTFWNRWLPLVASGTGIWLGVTALALVAFQRRRARDQRLRRLWEEEESALAELAALRSAEEASDGEPDETVH